MTKFWPDKTQILTNFNFREQNLSLKINYDKI